MLKNTIPNELTEIQKVETEVENIIKSKEDLITEISKAEEIKELKKRLDIKTQKDTVFKVYPINIFNVLQRLKKPKAYIFYVDYGNNLSVYKIDQFKKFIEQDKETFIISNHMGYYMGKPFFLVYKGIPITLSVSDAHNFAFDSFTLHNIMEEILTYKLTAGRGSFDFGTFIKKYWLIIVVIVFLFFTPYGKELTNSVLNQLGIT